VPGVSSRQQVRFSVRSGPEVSIRYRRDRGPEPMSGLSDTELTRGGDWQMNVF
jgi:hypothetical protein